MKLPWVSRHTLAAVERASAAMVADAQLERDRWADSYRDLMAKYHMLKLQGYALPEPQPVAPKRKESDPCIAAINEMTRGNRELRAMAIRQLADDRANGMSEGEILQRIQAGTSVIDGIPA